MKYIEQIETPKISKIGLGTGKFGTIISEHMAFEMLDYFWKHGGTLIDTARNYYEWINNGRGKSEECIGRWLEKSKNRKSICICTKGGVKNVGSKWLVNLSSKNIEEELKASLEALRTNYIDVYLLHRDDLEKSVEEIVYTMQYIKEIGNISIIGVANWTYERIVEANKYAKEHNMEPFQIIQTWWSLAEYTFEMWEDNTTTHMDESTYQYMLDEKIIGMAYTSQCKGFFQKVINQGIENIDDFLKYRILTERNLNKANYIKSYCEKEHISPTAIVSGYITSNKLEGVALVSCTKIEQLEDIVINSDYTLKQEVIDKLDSI